MHQAAPRPPLDPTIRRLLDRLRRRIRLYIWAEALAAALLCLGLAFWFSLLWDWGLEPPAWARGVVLVITVGALLAVIYRYALRRAFVGLKDSQLALLFERAFPPLGESLVTSVELAEEPQHAAEFHAEMRADTHRRALEHAESVPLRRVFRPAPLASKGAAALVLVVSVVLFAVLARDAFAVWADRNLFLAERLWPRKTRLQIEGFPNGYLRVARGTDVTIVVTADTSMPLVPETLELRYVAADGTKTRERVGREGQAPPGTNSYQRYKHVIKGLTSSLTFDVLGGDDRLRDLRIDVVDSPVLTELTLDLTFPAYTRREPRQQPAHGITPLPRGTQVTVQARANKPLTEVTLLAIRGQKTTTLAPLDLAGASDPTSFVYTLGDLQRDQTILFTLHDADGIVSRDPVRLVLTATPDDAPKVALRLRGIGSAVTPQARLPVEGQITDDYGLTAAAFQLQVGEQPPLKTPFAVPLAGRQELKLDGRQEVALDLLPMNLVLGQKLRFRVAATDNCELGADPIAGGPAALELLAGGFPLLPWPGPLRRSVADWRRAWENVWIATVGPNVGLGEESQLEVVSPPQLLALLESRELTFRRRLETIIEEMTQVRDSLTRAKFNAVPAAEGGAEPTAADTPPAETTAPTPSQAHQLAEARVLLVSRAASNSQRNGHDALGLSEAFEDMHAELVNNRIDASDRKLRLREGIAIPLARTANESFAELQRRLKKLEAAALSSDGGALLDETRGQADAILGELQAALDQMLKLEDFNQLVDMLREVIQLQGELNQHTTARQKASARSIREELEE